MGLKGLKIELGPEIESAEEETFALFSRPLPSSDLGFVDPTATTISVSVGTQEFTITQSPGLLGSSREGGTTGAVLWRIAPLFAEWLGSARNPLAAAGLLGRTCTVLELGCGISPLGALATRGLVGRYILTDQAYVSRLVAQNVEANPASRPRRRAVKGGGGGRGGGGGVIAPPSSSSISFLPLDWEADDVASTLRAQSPHGGVPARVDVVVACDCVYNDGLIRPLVDTCADACAMGRDDDCGGREGGGGAGAVCVVAQQLRHADVFEAWLAAFADRFAVWRVPDSGLVEGLRPDQGFVVHVGVLKSASASQGG